MPAVTRLVALVLALWPAAATSGVAQDRGAGGPTPVALSARTCVVEHAERGEALPGDSEAATWHSELAAEVGHEHLGTLSVGGWAGTDVALPHAWRDPAVTVEALAGWSWASGLLELELEWATAITTAVDASDTVDHGVTAVGALAVPLRPSLEVVSGLARDGGTAVSVGVEHELRLAPRIVLGGEATWGFLAAAGAVRSCDVGGAARLTLALATGSTVSLGAFAAWDTTSPDADPLPAAAPERRLRFVGSLLVNLAL